eukprot:scaffold1868_cov193-Cylindrotheca_fusiformis.AAC.22
MALKAFHDNPCIGGFGGESTLSTCLPASSKIDEDLPQSGDALCQIVKELVDNAMDACKPKGTNQRVKVEILPYEHDDRILKIQVSDTGVGMTSIQECVDVFQSSKGLSESKTAGRYGVGLTLCMLHSQRLISNSYCCITSATKEKESYTRAFYVVDTKGDSVVCQKQEKFRKPTRSESGTCVSVLVPVSTQGGVAAKSAWRRLENYFVRFQLRSSVSSGARPDLEVLAPTLSTKPIFVRAQAVTTSFKTSLSRGEDNYADALEGTLDDQSSHKKKPTVAQQKLEPGRKAAFLAGRSFLGDYVMLENVAHSVQSIRMDPTKPATSVAPRLELDVFVCPDRPESDLGRKEPVAMMRLIRMVNDVPLLDGAEGCACGLVRGLANKLVWGSFGLHVAQSNDTDKDSWTPLFDVRDSDHVAPFFQQHQHGLWTGGIEATDKVIDKSEHQKRKPNSLSKATFPPAKARLGDITIVIKIRAAPSTLPLPTLSKGRLPLNHSAIDTALQLGLRDCLRSLQRTNPRLLLTPTQLRAAVREVRYIPAMASAVSKIISRSSDVIGQKTVLQDIRNWRNRMQKTTFQHNLHSHETRGLQESRIRSLTERQLRHMIAVKQTTAMVTARRKRTRKQQADAENEYSDLDGTDIENECVESKSLRSYTGVSKSNRPTLEAESDISWIDSVGSCCTMTAKPNSFEVNDQNVEIANDSGNDSSELAENDDEWW